MRRVATLIAATTVGTAALLTAGVAPAGAAATAETAAATVQQSVCRARLPQAGALLFASNVIAGRSLQGVLVEPAGTRVVVVATGNEVTAWYNGGESFLMVKIRADRRLSYSPPEATGPADLRPLVNDVWVPVGADLDAQKRFTRCAARLPWVGPGPSHWAS